MSHRAASRPWACALVRADIQRPLAVVVMGGLVTSTLLTLLVVPTVYGMFAGSGRA